jgi:TP901 family phage tail tape measure protein
MSTTLNIALVLSAAVSGSVQTVLGGVQKTLVKLGDTTKELTGRQKRLGSVIKDLSLNSPHLASMQKRYREIGTAIDLVSSKQKRLNDLIKQGSNINQARDGYQNSMFETAGQAVAVGAPVLKSVQLAGNFQDQLRDVSITGDFSKKEEAALGATIRENALRFNQTQEDLSKGIGVLVAGGISSSKELAAFAPVLAKAATATRASVENLGSVFLAMRDNLKISAKDSESSLNMLAYAGKKGQFELKDMAKWLPNLAPQMAALGLTGKEAVAEIGAALQIARKGAGTNDEAANNFRNFLGKVTSPDTIKDFAKAGIDLKGDLVKLRAEGMTPMQGMLQLITQYMGTKGPEAAGQFTKALSIKDDAEREAAISRLKEAYKLGELFQDMQAMNFIKPAIANAKEMKDIKQGAMAAGGTDLLGADLVKRMEGFNEQWKGFTIRLQDLGISLGNTLLPPLSAAVALVSPLVGFVGALVSTFPKLSGALVLVVTGLLAGKMAILGFLYLKSMVSGFFLSIQIASASASAKLALFRVQSLLAGGSLQSLGTNLASTQWGKFVTGIKASIATTRLWITTQYQSLAASIAARGGLVSLSRSFADSLVSGLRVAMVAMRAFSLSLLTNPVGWVCLAIGVAALVIYKYWKPISGFFKGLWQGIKEGLKGLEPAWDIFKKIAPFLFPIITPLKWIYNAIKSLFKPVDDVGGKAQNMGLRFGKAIGGILSAILQLPYKMLAAGGNIIESLFQGMMNKINKPITAIKNLAQKLRNFLPFSPAKEGALRDINRVRIVETIAESMKPAPMMNAMRAVTAATMIAATPVFATPSLGHLPTLKPTPLSLPLTGETLKASSLSTGGGGGVSGGGVVITFSPQITIQGGGNADQIKGQVNEALQLSYTEFERMMKRYDSQQQRKRFSS